ncbi:group II intron maturase-specific domain-containing protein [Kitasatospora sp. NPDC050463]|uniref:group II intron maturase-specific domain-containing protein n=1 Tax=Kitasatospora sp. NPDC050463 TaxID=3155786 RepID=UPI0033DA18DF
MLHELNPIIRGWAAYFRSAVSSRVFHALDAHGSAGRRRAARGDRDLRLGLAPPQDADTPTGWPRSITDEFRRVLPAGLGRGSVCRRAQVVTDDAERPGRGCGRKHSG